MGPHGGRPVLRSTMFEGQAPSYYATYGRRPEGLLSPEEKRNLLIAVGVLTLCLAIVMFKRFTGSLTAIPDNLHLFGILVLIAFVSTATGFALHELAHKFVAQRYGCWAEFRYSPQGLVLALVIAIITPFIYAAPGAVYIVGRIDERQNGIISIAGPLTNVAVALALLPVAFLGSGIIAYAAYTVVFFNSFLAIFNMIPLMPLDGAKVLQWNLGVYIVALVGMGALLVYVWF